MNTRLGRLEALDRSHDAEGEWRWYSSDEAAEKPSSPISSSAATFAIDAMQRVALAGGTSPTRRYGRHALEVAAARLVALDRLEQRLEVAFAEARRALALDDLEEHRRDGR